METRGVSVESSRPTIAVLHAELDATAVLESVRGWAGRSGATVLPPDAPPEAMASQSQLIVAVGGDGTLLHAMHLAARYEIPMNG
jgi:NAD kinase